MEKVAVYSESQVAELEEQIEAEVKYARLLDICLTGILKDALFALIPPCCVLEISDILFSALPVTIKGVPPLHLAREVFIENVGTLSNEQIKKRHAFFDVYEELVADIPTTDRPLIILDEDLEESAFYFKPANLIAFSSQLIDEFEPGDEIIKCILAHELGHSVKGHFNQNLVHRISKLASIALMSTAGMGLGMVSGNPLVALSTGVLAGVVVAIEMNYRGHLLSNQAEYEADEYSIQTLKSVSAMKRVFTYSMEKYNPSYRYLIEKGFTEEQAMRLACAYEGDSYTHPSEWHRIQRAEKVVASLKDREIVQLEAA